jgi:cytochrome c oxidase subunit 1
MSTAEATVPAPEGTETNYLNCSRGLRSWLLTLDHKRIGVMYLISIVAAFVLGGLLRAAGARRAVERHSATIINAGHLQPAVHAARRDHDVPVHHPGHPGALGNFVLPIMLGAKDVAFPRLNLMSFYLWVIGLGAGGALDRPRRSTPAGRSTRPTARRRPPRSSRSPGWVSSSWASARSSPASTSS